MAAQPHCIRCGKCISVCPMHLMPLYLYSAERRGDLETLKRQNVLDCVECGSCAYTCPGCLPLVHSIRTAKQKLRDAAPPKPAPAPAKPYGGRTMPSKVKYFYELTVSSSPHVHGPNRTGRLMLDVILALLPALVGAVVSFGPRVLLVCGLSVAACVFFEWGYRKVMKLDNTVRDLSAVVTGLLLAFVCPVTIPYWTILVGDFFAIIIVKQLFGGIGKNFMNPALAARAFLFSWPVIMTTWVQPGDWAPLFGSSADAVTSATPLASLHQSALPAESLMSLFLGKTGGCLGETSALLLLLGGLYLVLRRVIRLRIPLTYLGTVALLTLLFPRGNDPLLWMGSHLLSGGLMLGAWFMATDYVTSPVTGWGQILYGVGCGCITVLIRYFGSYPEGVSYAILMMNACVVLLDKVGRPRRFGLRRKEAAK